MSLYAAAQWMRRIIVLCGVAGLYLRLHETHWVENQVNFLGFLL